MGIAAGRLRHRVRVEDLVTVLDSNGASEEDWADVFGRLLPAEIKPLSGNELLAAAATQSKVTTRIVMRYRAQARARMRVVHRETLYNIEAVVPDPESGFTWMTLHCSTGVSEGN